MEKVTLNATRRTVKGKQVGALRRQGILPGVIFGHHISPVAVSMNLKEATQILSGLRPSSLLTVVLDGEEFSTLVREKQRDYIKNRLLHVDFQAVSLDEKIRTEVSIKLVGIAPAIKDYNGEFIAGSDEIEVECLPQDLPEVIKVDISVLKKIGDGIYVRDIVLPENIHIHTHGEEMIAIITAPTKEEAEPGAEAAASATEPEVIEKGKKEEEVED